MRVGSPPAVSIWTRRVIVALVFVWALPPTRSHAGNVVILNAASYSDIRILAPETIAAAFGEFRTLDGQVHSATTHPLPTNLGGIRVWVNDRPTGVFYAGSRQVNFLMPRDVSIGPAVVKIFDADGDPQSVTVIISEAFPGLFSASSSGAGVAAAVTTYDGRNYQGVSNPDGTESDVLCGTSDAPNYLILFGTGFRYAPAGTLSVTIGSVPVTVTYTGPAPGFDGLDQINAIIPPQLRGLGSVNVRAYVNSRLSNIVTVKMGGDRLPVITTPLPFPTAGSSLSANSQVTRFIDGHIYSFDAYQFHSVAAATMSFEMHSDKFDPVISVCRVNPDGSYSNLATGDKSSGFGPGSALLMTVLPDEGDYVVFAMGSNGDQIGAGAYTLQAQNVEIQSLAYGAIIDNGVILPGDLQTLSGDYADVYWFAGRKGDPVQISLTSSDFDPHLMLRLTDGTTVASSGSSAGAQPTQVTVSLPADGVYVVIVTPLSPYVTGSYSLRIGF